MNAITYRMTVSILFTACMCDNDTPEILQVLISANALPRALRPIRAVPGAGCLFEANRRVSGLNVTATMVSALFIVQRDDAAF